LTIIAALNNCKDWVLGSGYIQFKYIKVGLEIIFNGLYPKKPLSLPHSLISNTRNSSKTLIQFPLSFPSWNPRVPQNTLENVWGVVAQW